MKNAAIYYVPEGFNTSGERLMGRHAAGEGFLKGFCQHTSNEELFCYISNPKIFEEFKAKVSPWLKSYKKTDYILFENPAGLEKAGVMFYPSPGIDEVAWYRRRFGQRLFAACGITHTTASDRVMQCIAELAVAPVQEWDAVICTSTLVKKTIEHELEKVLDYMAIRFGNPIKQKPDIMLPVIPLGVDAEAIKPGRDKEAVRAKWRDRHQIGEHDIAVLFVGRLSFHAKAHPLPMYLALEKCAKVTGKRVHLIQAGWFANDHIAASFKNGAKQLCPSVNCIFLDGRMKEVRDEIWYAADIFCSLSDSIQETFGLTPIEAMAAGLPQVVTDWDGYKDTVRDGVDGFRIPTITLPPGSGDDLAFRHEFNIDSYDKYCANAGLCVAVDIDATVKAFVELVNNPDLRRKMGEAGRKRAEEVYDWKHVIKAYEELWAEQNRIRTTVPERYQLVAGQPGNPAREDPFALFAGYPSEYLTDETMLRLSMLNPTNVIGGFRQMALTNYGTLLDFDFMNKVCAVISDKKEMAVAEIIAVKPECEPGLALKSIMWMMKFGILAKCK